MSSNAAPTKPRWAVGAFLQSAVSGVESRLDNILANDEEALRKPGLKGDERASLSTTATAKAAGGGMDAQDGAAKL
jgi:hypothetical protein